MPHASPRAVETVLNFHGGQKSFYVGTVGEKRRAHVPIPTTILDIRGHESDFSLDKQGFQFVNHGTEVKGEQFEDEEIVKGIYYQECEELVMEKTGASRVVPISYIVRRQNWDAVEKMEKGMGDLERTVAPVNARYVHVDQSQAGARNRMNDFMKGEAAQLSQSRWAIINVWRPIQVIKRDALTMCDARSLPESQVKETLMLFRSDPKADMEASIDDDNSEDLPTQYDKNATKSLADRAYSVNMDNAAYEVLPPSTKDKYKWYYASEMNPDEALMLKIYDSTTKEGVAKLCAHSSFQCEEDQGPARQSLEVRCLVFWEGEE
ncbi:hypothetical protein LTR56_016663 [Elasticomyces elasticus]|nr:hypothetical protein LTR56_016663 [Elasticomyces elasticus]KAK3641558.1 hypothetical protein LTR22_016560 [Elasticomyces elasticus]KAK4921955.1 hypothetical protein LTR49_010729 [Elasticomyces elasticus]KAK5758168.1 hypothetical protein LTS12_011785 [Elasticomyces elasticus]